MSQNLEFDPAEVDRCAEEEYRRAAEIERKTAFPHVWFAQFVPATGKICKPVQDQAQRFFEELEACGKRLAAEHRSNSGKLLAFKRDVQCTDEGGAASIRVSGANYNDYFLSRHGVGQSGPETS